ncbi:MAG: DUF4974 domain-containing protein [Bacteroidales bacterium]|nr:DUF4974 domain-containing protein [Bacteroidales bacterium]
MPENILEIISRYLAGEASLDDIMQLSDWLNRDEINRLRLKQLKRFWEAPVRMKEPDVPFEKFFERIDSPHRMAPKAKKRHISSSVWMISTAAAVALLLMIISVSVFFNREEHPLIEYYSYNCISGVEQVVLPDSSIVYLNRGGKITYANNYKEVRSVTLEGEAYFDVMKASGLFTVRLGSGASIEVLGTRFNVQALGGDRRIVTTLEEGSVRFVKGEQQIMLVPDQQLIYDVNKADYSIRQVDADMYTAWKEYIYRYNGIIMQDLCKELERMYRVEIILNPGLKNVKVSGSFEYRHDLDQILNVMKKRMRFEWKREGNKIVIQ